MTEKGFLLCFLYFLFLNEEKKGSFRVFDSDFWQVLICMSLWFYKFKTTGFLFSACEYLAVQGWGSLHTC